MKTLIIPSVLLILIGVLWGLAIGRTMAPKDCVFKKIETLEYVYMFRAKGFSVGDKWECKEIWEDDFKNMYHTNTAKECIEKMLGGGK